jgi:DNA-binding CsgD family transcriptional regulator
VPGNDDAPSAAELSEVLEGIYDAVLDPARWTDVVARCCAFVGCGRGVIARVDMLHLDSKLLYAWGYEPAYLERLSDTAKANGLLRESLRRKICEVVSLQDARDAQAYMKTEGYRGWAKPQGIVDVLQAILDRSVTSALVAAFSRLTEDGPVDTRARERMAMLVPHLRRAFLIGRTMDATRAQAETLAEAIDGLAAGVFLVDADMHLIHANASGADLVARELLRVAGGVLRASDPAADRALARSVAQATRGLTASRSVVAFGGPSGRRYGAHVLPLMSGLRRAAVPEGSAAAAIFVRDTALDFPAPVGVLADLHGLTPAETRVLLLVLEMRGVPPVAAMLGLSEATVKTHLRGIFRKTGTANQQELVALVAGYQSPLAAKACDPAGIGTRFNETAADRSR